MSRACRGVARLAKAGAALILGLGVFVSAQQHSSIDIAGVLQQAGARVTNLFARAQSIMCLEKVALQRLGVSFGADGPARFVESELRLSWEPTADNPTPTEANMLRQVVKVNGAAPRKKDYDNCTTPEQQSSEEQPLSILLPHQREKYTFSYDRHEQIDRRSAIVIAYREIKKPTVDVSLVADNDNCISFDIQGGMRGRVWIDAETYDVLRLDRTLSGLVEIPLPQKVLRRGGFRSESYWTMERWDESTRFRRVAFKNPDETLVLPVSSSTLQITRGAGTPRLRTSTQYVSYRRFLTAGRIVPPQ
jgi:hypothetical protein